MSSQPFTDGTITRRRSGTSDDPYLDIKELVYVTQGKAPLTEIPYKFSKVQILEQVSGDSGIPTNVVDGGDFTGSSSTIDVTVPADSFYEIDGGIPTNNQYVVDYGEGFITFNPSQEGSAFIVQYKGTGYKYFSDKRIYTQDYGNGVVQTLNDVVTTGNEKITEITSSINNANTATINANNASSNYQNLINQQLLIYQPSVPTYSAISSAYPTPQLGWTTVAKDTGIRYRYNNYSWVDIGNSNEGDGFTVVLSATPPANTNVLWVNVPSGNSTAKVVQSATTPTDTSVIWWQP
jgi:hypothetical protein